MISRTHIIGRIVSRSVAAAIAVLAVAPPAQAQFKDIELKVTRKRHESADEKKTGQVKEVETEIAYSVEIKNLRFKPTGPMQVKYRIFYTDAKPGSAVAPEEKMAEGTEATPAVDAGKAYAFKTTPIKLVEAKLDSGWRWTNGAKNMAADGVTGYWFRVYDADGKLVAEYVNPSSLTRRKPW